DEFDPKRRREFFDSLTLLSVPSTHGVAFGTYLLEAAARGVPVVQPKLGSYPELMDALGGGVLYEPNDADTLARTLGELLDNAERRADLGRRGRESVTRSFSLEVMAKKLLEVYTSVVPQAVAGRKSAIVLPPPSWYSCASPAPRRGRGLPLRELLRRMPPRRPRSLPAGPRTT